MNGTCCCGAIRFEILATPTGASVCHCIQCRKMSGYAWSSARVPRSALILNGPVQWYQSSPNAQRGICPTCGSFLFWQAHGEDHISFALGAIDDPTGLTLEKHIFTKSKGDYYTLSDGIAQS